MSLEEDEEEDLFPSTGGVRFQVQTVVTRAPILIAKPLRKLGLVNALLRLLRIAERSVHNLPRRTRTEEE